MKPRTPVCYIAGPMSGLPEYNVPAFRAAATRLREMGFIIYSPVEIGEQAFGNAADAIPPEEYLRIDLGHLAEYCTQIALLPGWEHSVGARCEVAVAITLGFDFFDAETALPIPQPENVSVSYGYRQRVL